MKGTEARFALAAFLLALSLLTAQGTSFASKVDVQRVLETASLGSPFVFDVDANGAVLVLTEDNVYDGGSGEFLFGERLKNPGWLSFGGEGLQILVDGSLFVIEGGRPRAMLDVPLKSALFVSDGKQTFIGGISAEGRSLLFVHREGLGHKVLLELDEPIDAMALANGRLFFTCGSRIYVLQPGGRLELLAYLPGFSFIPSIAVDEERGILYFSDGESLYALRGGGFVLVRKNLGGMLRYRGGNLYVLSWQQGVLFRIGGISEAIVSPGNLIPLEDPCGDPVVSRYCSLEEKRAYLRVLVPLLNNARKKTGTGGNTALKEMEDYVSEQKDAIKQITARLAKESEAGTVGALWGGGLAPRPVTVNSEIATDNRGVGITLWDGSELRVGPDSKVALNDCKPSRECRQTLERGLLYFEPYRPPVEDMGGPAPRGFVIAARALSISFGSARLVVYVSEEQTSVVVIDGRAKVLSPEGDSVTIASGEILEASPGQPLEMPKPADIERLNRWWERIK